MNLYQHSLYTFESIEDNSVLVFTWSEATANMTNEDFKEALHNYAGFAFELGGPGLLVDVRNFRHNLNKEVMEWRNQACLPRYMAAGSNKMAYLMPPPALENMPEGDVVIGDFTDRYFDNQQDAVNWLSSR